MPKKTVVYLVISYPSFELMEKPMYVPIPQTIMDSDKKEQKLKVFTKKVLRDLMKLNYWTFFHTIDDLCIHSFKTRGNCIYPGIDS
jgi:hypothetical protein